MYNQTKVVKPSLWEKMKRILLLLVFSQFLFFGCTSLGKDFKTFYEPEYKVIDRGGMNVIVISKACSISPEQAISAARRTAEYHLRSIIGSQTHRKEFQTINHFILDQKTCFEVSARGLRSL